MLTTSPSTRQQLLALQDWLGLPCTAAISPMFTDHRISNTQYQQRPAIAIAARSALLLTLSRILKESHNLKSTRSMWASAEAVSSRDRPHETRLEGIVCSIANDRTSGSDEPPELRNQDEMALTMRDVEEVLHRG